MTLNKTRFAGVCNLRAIPALTECRTQYFFSWENEDEST